jgi:hypothetical protein
VIFDIEATVVHNNKLLFHLVYMLAFHDVVNAETRP